jgi:CheY-like chemotaxis protein
MSAPRTVLLVDDDADTRAIYGRMLTYMGYHVLEASTGGEAIAVATAGKPDVCLLDLGLPDIDGLAVATALRGNSATASTRIIALTAYVAEVSRRRALEAGCDIYLAKPILPRALLAVIQQLASSPAPSLATPATSTSHRRRSARRPS